MKMKERIIYSTEKGVIPIPYACMHEVCTPACIFYFYLHFEKKNHLPTSKSCNLVKEEN